MVNLEGVCSIIPNPNLFNPKAFLKTIAVNVTYSIQYIVHSVHKHCKKLIIHVSKLIILDKTLYPFNQYLLYVLKICLYRLRGTQVNKLIVKTVDILWLFMLMI